LVEWSVAGGVAADTFDTGAERAGVEAGLPGADRPPPVRQSLVEHLLGGQGGHHAAPRVADVGPQRSAAGGLILVGSAVGAGRTRWSRRTRPAVRSRS